MEQRTIELLFPLLRFAICNTPLTDDQKALYSEELLPELLALAQKHDVLHLASMGLKQNFPAHKDDLQMKKNIIKAVYRYEQLNAELEKMCAILEQAQIPFMPLKGSVIRKYYPEPWMRTSCDVDILVHEEDAEKAAAVLVDKCGYVYQFKSTHDISMQTPNRKHVELHYTLMEDSLANKSSEVLKTVWDTSVIREGYRYRHEMPDEMFYFYHIAHMAKHFELGGCGIRTFIDLWILNGLDGVDRSKRSALLRQGDLLRFDQSVCKLSEIWFGNGQMDALSQQMEDYILRGGVYGSTQNRIVVQQQKKGGKLRFILSRVFLPYDEIKFEYPILQKYRWLTPVMEVCRWFRRVFGSNRNQTMRKLMYSSGVSKDRAVDTREFLNHIGL